MNAEVFAEGFEKCRLLTRLLGRKVENLDDYNCPKIEDLVGEGKADSSLICSSCLLPTQSQASLCREERKSVWRQGNATLNL